MKKMLLILVMVLLGTGGGVGAGFALRKPPATHDATETCVPAADAPQATQTPPAQDKGADSQHDYVKLDNQFVVPLVNRDEMRGLIIMSLSLELVRGTADTVYVKEPKLRDEFLEVLFEHANMGGFNGDFTAADRLEALKVSLGEVALRVLGPIVSDVLITDIARQAS